MREYPMILSTGRTLFNYNIANMTRKTAAIEHKQPENFVEVHRDDAAAIGIKNGDMVKVETRPRFAGGQGPRGPQGPSGMNLDGLPPRGVQHQPPHERRLRHHDPAQVNTRPARRGSPSPEFR